MQVPPKKNGGTSTAYSAASHSSWPGSQTTSSALNGSRAATAKPATAVTANSAAEVAKATG